MVKLNKWITQIPKSVIKYWSKDIIRLDLNENPYPPSPKVISVLGNTLSSLNRYPLGGIIEEAKSRIADYCNVDVENIFICSGSDLLVYTLMETLLNENDTVVTIKPTFVTYILAAKRMGARVEYIHLKPDNMFKLDINDVLERVRGKKVFILSNPNNPTGNILLKPREIEEILKENPELIVIVDEAYYEFSNTTVAHLIRDYPNLIVLRTFSKAFSLAGLRVGYSISSSEIVDYLTRVHGPFPLTTLAYYAIVAALEDIEYMRSNVKKIINERERVRRELSQMNNIKVFPSETNFLLFQSSMGGLVEKLLKYGIAIRDFSKVVGKYYYRVSVGLPSENTKFIESLKNIIENHKH